VALDPDETVVQWLTTTTPPAVPVTIGDFMRKFPFLFPAEESEPDEAGP
jgi:hypothetical protein